MIGAYCTPDDEILDAVVLVRPTGAIAGYGIAGTRVRLTLWLCLCEHRLAGLDERRVGDGINRARTTRRPTDARRNVPVPAGWLARSAGIAAAASASLLLVTSPALAVDVPTRADVQRARSRRSGALLGRLGEPPER
jgi:hypothetical protein